MQMTEQIDWLTRSIGPELVTRQKPEIGDSMESRVHCAYNQTRECFLGLEVAAAEFSYADLAERLHTQALKSGEGLWMIPFRGIPSTGLYAPLDLIYLDAECRVIDAVESFPTYRVNASSPKVASVLAVPAHSIYSSQTQPGDQLVLCMAEEMEGRLERISAGLSNAPEETDFLQGAVLLREEPLWSGGPGLVELEDRSAEVHGDALPAHEMSLIEPGIKAVRPPKNWLERWWSPDPRKAPRESSPGLAAYYWNGSTPKSHVVRDVSSTGLYVVTEERWYPGTLLLMTLQKTDAGEEIAERTISVMSRAVRWGNDGVGLQFVLPEDKNARKGDEALLDGASKREFARFLKRLLKGKS
jgi:hypothetical protein